ncbi:MAG: tetratricopeptide repeat protein [Xanthomonadales bacterium]|nr:tetratricopeptide repeat protein [Xanthomonadales bacterium]
MSLDRQTRQAMQLQRQGDLEQANQAWQRILHSHPNHVPALANLASLQARSGHPKRAIKLFRRALKIEPQAPEIWFNLGNLMSQAGDRLEAERSYRKALKLNKDFAPAWNNLGALLRELKRTEDAAKCFHKAIELVPGLVRAHCAYADLMLEQGNLPEALKHFTLARESDPTEPLAYLGLGNVLAENRQYPDAIEAFKGGLALRPGDARFLAPLAELFVLTGQEIHAHTAWQSLLEHNPDSAEAHLNLGRLLYRMRSGSQDVNLAVQHLRRAVKLKPGDLEPRCQLGFTLAELGELGEAGAIARQLLSQYKDSALAYMLEGYIAVQQARIAEGLDAYRKACAIAPQDIDAIGNLCFSSLYADFMSAAEVTELHHEMSGRFSGLATGCTIAERQSRQGRIRVGYLSPDFRAHPVGYFMEPILANHDRHAFEIFAYANVARLDETGQTLAGYCDHFRMCAGLDDETLLNTMREDRLDVLVDLAGYTSNNRVSVVARRGAPVQAIYLGYPGTTGLEQVDFCLGDKALMPEGSESLYSEQAVRLESPFLCFQAQPGTPDVAPLPAAHNGFITFGSCNNYAKVSDRCVQTWARLLDAVPGSRLIIKAQVLADPHTCDLAMQRFTGHGIDAGRIDMRGPTTPLTRFLGTYADIDIALDTLPYCGGTTSCDALWMGVPVVSLAGEHFYQRMGASILSAIHREAWCAGSEDEYIEIAARLAGDLDALARVRANLRAEMRSSPLCDGAGLARELERAYRMMIEDKQ